VRGEFGLQALELLALAGREVTADRHAAGHRPLWEGLHDGEQLAEAVLDPPLHAPERTHGVAIGHTRPAPIEGNQKLNGQKDLRRRA
jgi:hypothetical protein